MPDRAEPMARRSGPEPTPPFAVSPAAEVELGALEATLPPVRSGAERESRGGRPIHPHGDPS